MPHTTSTLTRLLAICAITSAVPAQWAGEWAFDETSGTTAKDISGNSNDGTLLGFSTTPSPWVAGKVNNALEFDGVDDYVALPLGKGLPMEYESGTPFTIAYWIKAPPQANKFVYAEGPRGTSALVIFGSGQYTADSAKFRTYARNDQGKAVFQGLSSVTVYDDTWHHVALIRTADSFRLFVDGVEDTAHNIKYNAATPIGTPGFGTFTFGTASIGCLFRGSPGFFTKGVIDDLRIYNFAVVPADVKLMMVGIPKIPCTSSLAKYGQGCGTIDISATGSASYNQTLTLQLSSGPANAPAMLFAGLPVSSVDLSILGFPGCTAYASLPTSLLVPIGALNGTGSSAPINLTVPAPTPSLDCVVAAIQGVGLGASLEVSQAVLAQIGK